MDPVLLQKFKDSLSKSNSIGVMVGNNPTVDQMAAALSLYLSLNKVNKKAIIASPTNPIVEVSSLVGVDKVQTTLGVDAAGDLVVTFPYNEGEIDKVSYTLENNFLNIIVKAGEKGLTFDEKDVKFIRGGGENIDLLFVIGTPRVSDLGDLLSGDKLKNVKIVNIDNKAENQGYGDIVQVIPTASSISELVTEILVELGFNLDKDVSQNLMSGMVSATDNFKSPNSSALAFEMAGILMQRGATRSRDDFASSSFTPNQQIAGQIQPVQQMQPQVQPQQSVQPVQIQQPEPQPVQQVVQPTFEQKPAEQNQTQQAAPLDWLTPKVYKGGSGVSSA